MVRIRLEGPLRLRLPAAALRRLQVRLMLRVLVGSALTGLLLSGLVP